MRLALRRAIMVLVEPNTRPAALRRAILALIDACERDMVAPSTGDDDAALPIIVSSSDSAPCAASPQQLAQRITCRSLLSEPIVRPAPPHSSPPGGRLRSDEWLKLRASVMTEQRRCSVSREGLAVEIGLAAVTVHNALTRRTSPSAATVSKLREWLLQVAAITAPYVPDSGNGTGAHAGAAPRAAVAGLADGQAASAESEEADALATRLRAKRLMPMTTVSVAEQIGVALDEPDMALSGRPALASAPIPARLRARVAEPPAAPGPVDGQQGAPLEAEALTALKRKRHVTPTTSSTLAQQVGVDVTQLEAALMGRAIPPMAAGLLRKWASA